jgi:hypothetical protein
LPLSSLRVIPEIACESERWALAISHGRFRDIFEPLLEAAVAFLRALGPFRPFCEYAVLVTSPRVAALCVGGFSAWLASILRGYLHITLALLNTTAALRTA